MAEDWRLCYGQESGHLSLGSREVDLQEAVADHDGQESDQEPGSDSRHNSECSKDHGQATQEVLQLNLNFSVCKERMKYVICILFDCLPIMSRSELNLFNILPVGVVSKKIMGACSVLSSRDR